MAQSSLLTLTIFLNSQKNIFSITDVTSTPVRMCAYRYEDDGGGKGVNNDVSLVITGLVNPRLIWVDKVDKPLIIIIDNCGAGKNKKPIFLQLEFSW